MSTWIANVPEAWDRRAAIILAHGAGQGMHSLFMSFFHTELARCGFLSVKFNFDYMEARRNVPDPQPKLQAAFRRVIEEVAEKHRPRHIFAGGKSMGGRVSSYIAKEVEAVRGLVFLGYPLHPPGKPDQLRDAHLYGIGKPMLFVSGTRDNFATRELLDSVIRRIGPLATMVWIEGGDHSLRIGKSKPNDLGHVVKTIEDWIGKVIS